MGAVGVHRPSTCGKEPWSLAGRGRPTWSVLRQVLLAALQGMGQVRVGARAQRVGAEDGLTAEVHAW